MCKIIRSDSTAKNVPIIIMTGTFLSPKHKVTGLELGADDYIVKPFDPMELVARIKAVMRRKIGVEEEK